MFDLIAGGPRHPFHNRTIAPTVASIVGHGVVLLAVAGASFVVTSDQMQDLPDMMAFVAAARLQCLPRPRHRRRAIYHQGGSVMNVNSGSPRRSDCDRVPADWRNHRRHPSAAGVGVGLLAHGVDDPE